MQHVPRVFLAAPFAQWVSPDGLVDQKWRDRLETLRLHLLNAAMPVFSAHHNEGWGAGWLPSAVCVPNDFRAMETCDVVCAYLGTPASAGVCVELGWAAAMRKPVLLVMDRGVKHSQMIEGLATITHVRQLVLADGWTDAATVEIFDATRDLADDWLSRGHGAWRDDAFDECLGYARNGSVFQSNLLAKAVE
jgi:nucleoside 2-deoxyribosyltransferase